jgi:antitoxin (DNA-binding transcriptional repressor) of toxin-antitoxin stability system
LVELAHKVSAGAEGVVAKSQGSIAEILPGGERKAIASASALFKDAKGREERRGRRVKRKGELKEMKRSARRLTMLPA